MVSSSRYYLFRSWGRTGTTVGGNMTQSFAKDLEACKEEFERLFLEKSQNEWETVLNGTFKVSLII